MSRDRRPEDDDRARYERELRTQREKQQQLERSAIAAFAEWFGELTKQFVKSTVHTFWSWLRRVLG